MNTVSPTLQATLTQLDPELVTIRRDLHAHPELSWHEVRTTDLLGNRLADAGLRVRRLPGTGLVVVLVDATGERTMLPSRGANAGLRADDVTGALDVVAAFPGGMPHVHVSGYVLLDGGSRAAGLAALDSARRRGWTTSVDPQAAALVREVGAATFLGWVHGVDLLLPNAAEAHALGGIDAMLAAVGAVAVTDGAAGARWYAAGGLAGEVAAQRVEAVDTTGAGDAFNGGLLAAWVAGADPQAALAAGVAAGTAVVAGRV